MNVKTLNLAPLESSLEAWRRYWPSDGALFRSEVGIAWASDFSLLERFGLIPGSATEDVYNLWRHSAAARASKTRFPRCGGFIVWMGHDTFPCPVSLSILDFDGKVKPAGHALAKVFLNDADSNLTMGSNSLPTILSIAAD